jgi:3-isopropylmalate/(R)-2-methylmalate dehydratase small subunit
MSGSEVVRGRVWKYGDDVDTDVLFPGKHTYTARGAEEIAAHALEDLDPEFAAGVRPGDVVVGGRNFGCGSSREQAVTCLVYNGVQAVIAKSFSRIFYRNAVNQGLWPLTSPAAVDFLRHGETVVLDLAAATLDCGAGRVRLPDLDPHLRAIVEAGGLVPFVQRRLGRDAA